MNSFNDFPAFSEWRKQRQRATDTRFVITVSFAILILLVLSLVALGFRLWTANNGLAAACSKDVSVCAVLVWGGV